MKLQAPSSFWALCFLLLWALSSMTVVARMLATHYGFKNDNVRELNQKVDAWWPMLGLCIPALAGGVTTTTLLFGGAAFLALREFISLAPTRPADRAALCLAFFVATPLQFALVGLGWYGIFSILLPVYGFFAMAVLPTLSQDTKNFLERSARIQWAVMVCVYGLSHIPALMTMEIPGYAAKEGFLVVFLLIVSQISDVTQYLSGKAFGRFKLAPALIPVKTWEGLALGLLLAVAAAAGMSHFTPFTVAEASGLGAIIVVAGLLGNLVLASVKRSLGTDDWGYTTPGLGGALDRLDSVAFAAPLFFHLTRYLYGS
jgi:phosphatidate cytidylyltransferase